MTAAPQSRRRAQPCAACGHASRALHEVTGLPVLGVVSRTWLDKYRLQQRRQYIGYSVGAVALVMVFVVVLRFSDVGVRAAQRLLG